MPDAIITSTASTFGTISGTFAADQSTVTGTVTGIVAGTLSGSVGVPGPAGAGVPAGGTAGQVLQKATNTSYDTVWATPSGGTWGTITGTLSNQTDLQTALNLKAPLASPALTGVPTAPTAATLTSTTQLATTAFVQQELLSGTANARNLEVYVRNQTGSTIPAGAIVYINGATGNRPTITLAQANNDANSAQTFGFTKASIANNGFGFVIVRGELENIDTSALTEGVQLYLSPTTAGTWTTTKPSAPQHLVYVGICVRAHPTQGVILVAVQNGYELNELHDVQITSPTNGQVLKYNSSTSLWYNGLDVGIPVGGTAGQFLTKIDGTDYNTDWTTVNLSVYAVKSNNLSDLTSAPDARTNLGLGTMATATASDYSTTTVANGLYYPLTGNPSGFITSSALTGYATESWVTAGFYPLTGNPSGFITSSALTPYLTSATAAATYQTLSGMSSYLTTSAAASTYAALAGATFTGKVTTIASTTGTAPLNIPHGSFPTTPNNGDIWTTATGIFSQVNGSPFQFAQIASPGFSGVPTAPTATAGTSTTQLATTAFVTTADNLKANLASPTFTGTPTLPTGTIATTQTAGNNTTAVATTAFVTAAVPAFGATADVKDPVSTTKAASIDNVRELLLSPGYQMFYQGVGVNGTSGSGAATNANSGRWKEYVSPNAGVAGHAKGVYDTTASSIGFAGYQRGANLTSRNWSKKIWMSGRSMIGHFSLTSYNGSANTWARVSLGGYTAIGAGDMTSSIRGIGWRLQGGGSSALELQVSNGSTVTTVTSSFTPVLKQCFDWEIYSDGAGNVTLFVNDSQVATTTAGPTGTQTSGLYMEGMDTTASSTAPFIMNNLGTKIFVAI